MPGFRGTLTSENVQFFAGRRRCEPHRKSHSLSPFFANPRAVPSLRLPLVATFDENRFSADSIAFHRQRTTRSVAVELSTSVSGSLP